MALVADFHRDREGVVPCGNDPVDATALHEVAVVWKTADTVERWCALRGLQECWTDMGGCKPQKPLHLQFLGEIPAQGSTRKSTATGASFPTPPTLRITKGGAYPFPGVVHHPAPTTMSESGPELCGTFVDCRAAYYRLIRELAIGDIRRDSTIEYLFHRFNLDGEDICELRDLVCNGGMLCAADIPDQIRAAVRDFHLHTWAVTRFTAGEQLCTSKAGSRPGASWADTIFSFICAKILYKVHELLEGEDLNFHLPWDESGGPFAQNLIDEPQQAWDTTWADDTAWAIEGDTAEHLIQRTKRISSVVVSLFRSHGLSPNLKRDKTSILMRLVGAGARTARRRYFSSGKAELYLEDLQEAIPIVKHYRHLGASVDGGVKLLYERRHRTALAGSAYESAKDLLLQNRDLQIATRAAVFQTAVVATYFNLPLWVASGGEWDKMSDAFSRLVRRLLSREIPGPALFKVPAPLAHWATGIRPLELYARRSRISALVSMAKAAPPILWVAIQNEPQWKSQLCGDLRWLVLGDEQNWPQANEAGWPHWCQVIRDSPDRLRRRARRRNQEEFADYQKREALSVTLWTMYRSITTGENPTKVRPHRCFMCDKDFKNKAGLGAHLFKTHGRWALYRQCVTGTFCQACQTEYWSVGRLEDHLRASPKCASTLMRRGCTTAELHAGYGSKKRRQKEVEQFTLAPPKRTSEAPELQTDPVWTKWQTSFYEELCETFHDMRDCSEQLVFDQVWMAIRRHPLYEQEIKETLEVIAREMTELQEDVDLRPWSPEQFNHVIHAVQRVVTDLAERELPSTQPQEDLLSRASFGSTMATFDWSSKLQSFSCDHGTPDSLLFILEGGWEALWPPARGRLLDIAVVTDPLMLLPKTLVQTWRAFLNGKAPVLRAPASFWGHSLSAPFVPFRERHAGNN